MSGSSDNMARWNHRLSHNHNNMLLPFIHNKSRVQNFESFDEKLTIKKLQGCKIAVKVDNIVGINLNHLYLSSYMACPKCMDVIFGYKN